jgi:site-specific DNA recombinase
MKKAVIYARVSTAGQEEKGSSLESQVKSCRAYAEQNGYTIVRVVEEVFSGAYLHERPQISAVRDEVRAGKYDAVIAHAIDRVSRDTAHLFILSDECNRYDTKLLFVSEDLDNSAQGKLLQSVTGFVAEVEREKIRERSLRGKRTKAASKTLSFGHKLYGYEYDKENRVRVIVPEEAAVVIEMFEGMLEGKSIRGIAQELDERGVPTARLGVSWNHSSVRRLLKNTAYAGITYAFRYQSVFTKKDGKTVHQNKERDKSEWVQQADNLSPALVSLDTFNQVQQIIAHNRDLKRRSPVHEMLLRGRVVCEVCGRVYTTNIDPRGGYGSYVCQSQRTATTRCGNPSVSARRIEPVVWEKIAEVLANPELVIAQIEETKQHSHTKRNSLRSTAATNAKAITRVETELRRLVARAASVDDSVWELMQEQINAKTNELTRLRALQSETDLSLSADDVRTVDLSHLTALSAGLARKLDKLSFAEKSRVLSALEVKVGWNGDRLRVQMTAEPLQGYRGNDR